MWIIIRIAAALIFAVVQLIYNHHPRRFNKSGSYDGKPYSIKHITSHKHEITGFRLGMPLPTKAHFKFLRESSLSRFFKFLGLGTEYQTGDAPFDRQIYLACDHSPILEHLGNHPQSRELIVLLLIEHQFDRLASDGDFLWATKTGAKAPSDTQIKLLAEMVAAFAPACQQKTKKLPPFFWQYLLIDFIVMIVVSYGLAGLIENMITNVDVHLSLSALITTGLTAAVITMILIAVTIKILLRNSSRGYAIFSANVLLLLICLPAFGIQLVSDVNRILDTSEVQTHEAVIASKSQSSSAFKRRSRSKTYQLHLQGDLNAFGTQIPSSLNVSQSTYQSAAPGKKLLLSIKPGYLGLPWCADMKVQPE